MQTQEGFSIKNYADRDGLEANLDHCSLFLHFSSQFVSAVIGSTRNATVYSLRILEDSKGRIFENTSAGLQQMMDSLVPFKHEFVQTKIIIDNSAHALVPDVLFAGEKASSFLKLNTPLEGQSVLFNRIARNKVSIFAVPETFHAALRSLLPGADILHEVELLTGILPLVHQKESKEPLYVLVHEHDIVIAYMENNDLHYLNSFPVEADTDVIYFILSVAELLKLNQDKLQVSFFGNVNPNGTLPGLAKKYVPYIDFLKKPGQYSYPASFREFPDHYHYTAIGSLVCAS